MDSAEIDDGNRRRFLRIPFLLRRRDNNPATPPDQNPLLLVSPPPPPPKTAKKKSLASVAFRGLGCTSAAASQVYEPPSTTAAAAHEVRASADWQAKRSRSRRKKGKAKMKESGSHEHQSPPLPRPHTRKNQIAASAAPADLWCAPGVAFDVADNSLDCLVSHHHQRRSPMGRGGRAADGERDQRERICIARRGSENQEQLYPLLDSPPSTLETPPGHYHHMRGFHHSPGRLEEIMMFLGGTDVYDQYRDWRLDVDNMSYEELLELGDTIGYVNNGLREEEIFRCLRQMKHSTFHVSPSQISTERERKCSICQEEYEVNDDVGKLVCGHSYHTDCIKQWLLRKNVCPVCKTAAAKN